MRLIRTVLLAGLASCTGPAGPTEEPVVESPLAEAGYLIAIRGGDHRTSPVAQPLKLSIDITRQEGGWDGPITFTAEAPAGIVVGFRPATVLRDFTDVIIVADASVEPRDHQVVFHGTVPGHADRVVALTLTLQPRP